MTTVHPYEFSQEGFWKGWIAVTRSGVFKYLTQDGRELWLRREPVDVFSEEHLNSLKGMPIVLSHPSSSINSLNVLDSDRPVIGSILSQFDYPTDSEGNPTEGYLHAQAVIWAQDAIELITKGHGMVSEGYTFDFAEELGESIDINDDGEWTVKRKYNGKQKRPIANHVAVLDSDEQGRAGKYARVVFDSDKGTIELESPEAIAVETPESANETEPVEAIDSTEPIEELVSESTDEVEPDAIADEVTESTKAEDVPETEQVEATDSILDLEPTDSAGMPTIDNSNDPVYKMLKMIANASAIAPWLYISPHIELTLGNIARSIISAINYSADLPENDDMAVMKAEILLETVRTGYDSTDAEVKVIRIGDSANGKLTIVAKPRANDAIVQPAEVPTIQPPKPAIATDSVSTRKAPVIEPLPAFTPVASKPNPAFAQMAMDARTLAGKGGKPDRTASLYKNWK